MNKIINGRRYDTESAKVIATDSFSNRSDFNFWEETLYRKSTGEFFLYGVGGPMSRYAESAGQNVWSGGAKIIPLTLESAQRWAEEHLNADEYEEIFGSIEESTEKRTVTFSLSESTIETIARIASENRITKSEVIEQAVKKWS